MTGAHGKSGGVRGVLHKLFLAVFALCLVALVVVLGNYHHQSSSYQNLAQTYANVEAPSKLAQKTVDWEALRAINPDIVGWVTVPGTSIDYPIVQTTDNETYLHRSFEGATGFAGSAGCVFADCANSATLDDQLVALYGHHMRDGSMFAALAKFSHQGEFDGHRTIYVLTPTMNYRLTTFSCVITNGYEEIVQPTFATEEDFHAYLTDKLERSTVTQAGTTVEAEDVTQCFLLSTCEYTRQNGRSVLYAAVTKQAVPVNAE